MNRMILTMLLSLFLISGLYGEELPSVTQDDGTSQILANERNSHFENLVSEEEQDTETSDFVEKEPSNSSIPVNETISHQEVPIPDQVETQAMSVQSSSTLPSVQQSVTQQQEQNVETQDLVEKESDGAYLQWIFRLLIVFGVVILAFLLFRKSSDSKQIEEIQVVQVAKTAAQATQKKDAIFLPFHIFPSDWFRNVDATILGDFIDVTRNNAVTEFFKFLKQGVPSTMELKSAQDAMGQLLNERMTSIAAIDMISGVKTKPDERNYLEQTLNVLLPAIKIPQPVFLKGEVNLYVLGFLAAIGAFFGLSLGGSFAHWGLGIPPEAGMMFGSVIGAGGFIILSMYLANHPKIRRLILTSIGTIAVADVLLMLFKAQLPIPKFLKGKTGVGDFLKRLGWYVLVFIVIFLIRREKTFDHVQYRESINTFVEQWIRSALPILAIFLVKPSTPSPTLQKDDNTNLVHELHPLVASLQTTSGKDREKKIELLVSAFKRRGYIFQETTSTMIWDDSLLDQYESIDAIPGDEVEVYEPPILNQKGVVVKKGKVIRKTD